MRLHRDRSEVSAVRRVSNVRRRNRAFTGRRDLLQVLRNTLSGSDRRPGVPAVALHGLGGVGKTQLAIEYAHRHTVDYDLVWWVEAEEPLVILSELVALAHRLGLPERANQEEQIRLLWDS